MKTSDRYDAFLSYSHADDRLAPALQRGLETLGKPWFRRSALAIFRDESSLSANPGLWSSIEQNLSSSAYFVLLASTEAARSPWVSREAAWWRANRPMERLLIVVAGGTIVWDAETSDFDWSRTSCLPSVLERSFPEEPLYVDLRRVEPGEGLSLRNPRFRSAVLTLAAPIHGKPKDELESEAIRQQRRFTIAASLAGAVVLASLLAAAYGVTHAWHQATLTEQQVTLTRQQTGVAESRRLAAEALARLGEGRSVDGAIVLATLAWRISPTEEAKDALVAIQARTADVAKMLGRHTAEIERLAFSGDGARLASADKDGTIVLWNTRDWKQAGEALPGSGQDYFRGRFHFLEDLVLDDAGAVLLTHEKTSDDDPPGWIHRLTVSDLATHAVHVLPGDILGEEHDVDHVSLSPDGKLVAVNIDDKIAVWDVRAGRLRAPPIEGKSIEAMRFVGPTRLAIVELTYVSREPILDAETIRRRLWVTDPTKMKFTSTGGVRVGLWDAATGRLTYGPHAKDPVSERIYRGVSLTDVETTIGPGGSILAFSKMKGGLMLLGVGPALELTPIPSARDLPEGRMGADNNGYGHVDGFDAAGRRFVYETDTRLSVWDIAPARRIVELTGRDAQDQPYRNAQLSPDGRWLASIVDGRIVMIHDLEHASSGAGPVLDASCSLEHEACIGQLCAKIAKSIDDRLLAELFDDGTLPEMKKRLTASCGTG